MATRVRRSRTQWEALVRALERSGESPAAFAGRRGLNEATLRWWRSRVRSAGRAVEFLDVVVEDAAPVVVEPFVVVLGGGGHRVVVPQGFDAGELRRLVEALC